MFFICFVINFVYLCIIHYAFFIFSVLIVCLQYQLTKNLFLSKLIIKSLRIGMFIYLILWLISVITQIQVCGFNVMLNLIMGYVVLSLVLKINDNDIKNLYYLWIHMVYVYGILYEHSNSLFMNVFVFVAYGVKKRE